MTPAASPVFWRTLSRPASHRLLVTSDEFSEIIKSGYSVSHHPCLPRPRYPSVGSVVGSWSGSHSEQSSPQPPSMPSLRRSFSSSSVRSSPYPSSLSNSSSNNARARVAGHGFRRSSDSEASERRVLADIEWWRVSDGQRDLDAALDQAELDQHVQNSVHVPAGGAITLSGSDSPHTPPLLFHDIPPVDFAQVIS